MFKKILAGYTSVLLAALRFLILLGVCIGTGMLFVYPLWRLASSRPSVYTLIFIIIFSLVIIVFAFKAIRTAWKQDSRRFLLSLARKASLLAGICVSIALVMNYQRAAAGVVLLVTIGLYGFLAFGLSADRKTGNSPTANT